MAVDWKKFRASCVPMHMLIVYVFVVSGLAVCFLMLLAYIFIWPFNKILYRKVVINLAYLHWSQFTAVSQWWSGSNCTVHLEDEKDYDYVGKEHVIAVMNHKYDIDWLMTWILAERFQMLGGTKIYGKQMLKFVPLIGWAWTFTESIFLKRAWDKDKEIISRDLQHIADQPDNYYITLLLFCEGTRFTEDKHKISMEVARKKGLPELKHHLLPRAKGFTHSMHGLKGKVPTILDLTVGFRKDGAEPTLMNIIRGQPCKAEIYARRIPLDSVPTHTDEACAQWLYKHYQEKDEIYDNFYQNGHFTIGVQREVPQRINDLLAWCFWAVVSMIPLVYFIQNVLFHASLSTQLALLLVVVIVFLVCRWMVSVTEIDKSASEYGSNVQINNDKKRD